MSRRGSTGPGRRAPLPWADYSPPPTVATEGGGGRTVVAFRGEDGRSHNFRIDELPLPGWHAHLAAGFASRAGPAGNLRTLASATSAWAGLRRFMLFLDGLPGAPSEPSDLLRGHVDRFVTHRADLITANRAEAERRSLARLLREPPLGESIRAGALEGLVTGQSLRRRAGRPGYSDEELTERVTVALERSRLGGQRRRVALTAAGETTWGHADTSHRSTRTRL